jgi:hypothetical protein
MNSKVEIASELADKLLHFGDTQTVMSPHVTAWLRACIGAPVVERQGRINTDSLHEHLEKCGDLLAGIALDIRRSIAEPPELAELQATISQLRAELATANNAYRIVLDTSRQMFERMTAAEQRCAELERLKGGQGEPRLVSYATDMSTCTLTLGDDTSYIYDRVCTPVPVGFVAHRLDEIGQSYEGVIYAPAILEGAVKQGTLLYTRDNSTSTAEDKS